MSVHQRNRDGAWYVSWRDENGKQHMKVTGKGRTGQRDAYDLDKDIKAKKRAGLNPAPATDGNVYLDQLAQAFLDAKKAEGKGRGWLQEVASLIQKNFYPDFCQRPANTLKYQEIVNIITTNYPNHSLTTRSRYLSYLKIMFQFAVDHEYLEKNPLALWKKPKEPRRRSMLTVNDLRRILANSAPHLHWAIEVAYNLGVRTGESELLALTWANVDWENSLVQVYATKTKTWRDVHIPQTFLERLREMKAQAQTEYIIEYKGKSMSKFRRSFKTACERAGITYKVTMYDIRHLYASTLLSKGGDLAAVSAQMGHSSTVMTANVYYHLMSGERKRAVALLPPLLEQPQRPEAL
jgi:integrase